MSDETENRRRRRRPRRRSRGGSGGGEGRTEGGANANAGAGRGRRPGNRGRARPRAKSGRSNRRPRRERNYGNWWARRWSEVLEGFQVGRRLGRGRSYARQGQVIEIELAKGSATAMVQGSRDAPYLVRMHFSMLSATDWKKVIRALGEDPDLGGRLLMGELPENIEQAFETQGLSLFPSASGDLKAACSCPDQANPCKHVAAVYYTLGEEFDRDPFLLFRIRGLERGELIEALARTPAARAAIVAPPKPPPAPEPDAGAETLADEEDEAALVVGEDDDAAAPLPVPPLRPRRPTEQPLPIEPHAFWAGEEQPSEELAAVRVPATPAALARRLGGFPFWRGEGSCAAVMEQVYRGASLTGLDVYLGEPGGETQGEG